MEASPFGPHRSTPVELKEQLAAIGRGAPFVMYRAEDGAQCIVELPGDVERMTIGRSPATDISLPWDREVSRIHAALERLGDEWTLVDDGLSSNGSFVNGARIRGRQRLCDGDRVQVGKTTCVFRSPPGDGDGATAVPESSREAPQLSDTQRRVLVALCRPFKDSTGFATPAKNKDIAEELFLSVDAVKSSIRVLFEKFGIEDLPQNEKRAALVERAFQSGAIGQSDL